MALAMWRGGYVCAETGDYFYLPAKIDAQVYHRLLKPYGYPEILRTLCKEGDVIFDVGANLGEWTVPMARYAGPAGRVIAFEPIPEMAEAVRKTCRINRLVGVTVVQAAASDQNGQAVFYVDLEHTGGSSLNKPAGNGIQIEVQLRCLDDYVSETSLVRCDLIKIDVEGAERQVIAGARSTLEKFRPTVIFETGLEDAVERQAICRLFMDVGYELVGLDGGSGIVEVSWSEYIERSGVLDRRGSFNLIVMPAMR
jgi:FkbM family methyltransferase